MSRILYANQTIMPQIINILKKSQSHKYYIHPPSMSKAFLITLTQFTEPNADADHISLLINKKKKIFTRLRMELSLSSSQSRMILCSFLVSRSWMELRNAASVRVSKLMDVTCQLFSAAVSRIFCNTVSPTGKNTREQEPFKH